MRSSPKTSPYRRELTPLLPSREALLEGLSAALGCGRALELVDREAHLYASTHPAEVVTCRIGARKVVRLLLKYGVDHLGSRAEGVAYETAVYRAVLAPLAAGTPVFFGSYSPPKLRSSWLLLEYLPDYARADDARPPGAALRRAARWAGSFHRSAAALLDEIPSGLLNRWENSRYRELADRAADYGRGRANEFPWFEDLCREARELTGELASAPRTVVHGEFTPHNILVRGRRVAPVDWERAAVGPGETDIAALTDGWPEPLVQTCVDEYAGARWGTARRAETGRRLDVARLFWHLGWLAKGPDWAVGRKSRRHFEQAHLLGSKLRLL